MSARVERYTCCMGHGVWPKRAGSYFAYCCGDFTVLPHDHQNVFQSCLQDVGGDESKAYLRMYTGDEVFGEVNRDLMESRGTSLKKTGPFIHHTKNAIKQRFSSRGGSTGIVWRGMVLPRDLLYLYQSVGRRFLWPNFVSTSHSRDRAVSFLRSKNSDHQNVLFRIDTNGVGLTYVVDVADISVFANEQEALFYPYSGFEISGVQEVGDILEVSVRTYDTKIFEICASSMIQECRFLYPDGQKRVLLAMCVYSKGGKDYLATSCALVPMFASCNTRWATSSTLEGLKEQIRDTWKKEMQVLCLSSGAGRICMFAVSDFGNVQSFKGASNMDDLKPWIQEQWDKGLSITSVSVVAGFWFVVMTSGTQGFSSASQAWATRNTWASMQECIRGYRQDGHIITDIVVNSVTSQFLVIVTKSPKRQRLVWSENFPEEWVREAWSAGFTVTKILYDTSCSATPWLVVATTDSGKCNSCDTGLRL